MPALSERDMRVLAFERGTWRTAGAKEQAIGDSVPSKSAAISARAGSATTASRPAWPSAVPARSEVTATCRPTAATACAGAAPAARAAV